MNDCPFCNTEKEEYLMDTEYSYAKLDDCYPLSEGHVLIISKQHVSNYFDLTDIVQMDMIRLVDKVKKLLDTKYGMTQYNV